MILICKNIFEEAPGTDIVPGVFLISDIPGSQLGAIHFLSFVVRSLSLQAA